VQFKAIPGHVEIKKHLIDEVEGGKISHAQLFAGKAGYATLPLALAFVQYLFCDNKQENDSCGVCTNCKKITDLQHPDVHFSFPTVQTISKTSNGLLNKWREQILEQPVFNLFEWTRKHDDKERKPIIGSDESLEIIKKLALKSYEGGYKVMIIWMAEEMNPTCSNKLLKLLEEPPAKTLFLLISENPDNILTTILSRTQMLRIPSFSMDEIQQIIEKEGVQRQQAESIAARSNGNLIDARNILNDQAEGILFRDLFIQLMRVCFKKNVNEMLDWTEEIGQLSREGQKHFSLYALHMIRQSILKNYTDNMLMRVSKEEGEFLSKFSRFISNNNVIDFMEIFDDAYYHLERNAAPKLLFTQVCFQVMRFIHKA
jgi:DNA polymerase-3 subunit delta'